MGAKSPVLVYSAYGGHRWLREAQFSALTALAWQKHSDVDYRVAVYTDHPEYFERYPLDLHHVTAEQHATWAGPDKFNYRVKFHVLMDAFERYEAPCVLFDSDTFVKASLDPLLRQVQPGVSIMDQCDGFVFRDPRYVEFAELFRKGFPALRIPLGGDEYLTISERDAVMLVSGIVGIHHADRHLVDLALRALNGMLSRVDYFVLEQFAFAEVLRQHSRVVFSAPYIEHYWGSWVDPYFGVSKRDFYQEQIEAIFKEFDALPIEEGLDLIHRTRIRPYTRPLPYRLLNRIRAMVGLGT